MYILLSLISAVRTDQNSALSAQPVSEMGMLNTRVLVLGTL